MWTAKFISRISRRKTEDTCPLDSQLRRCMNLFDLTVLGIASLMDAGLYVVIGQMAHDKAGPAVILSFLIASTASLLAGLCYAEFASRITKAGSAYTYTYVAMGEMWAFLTGWCMIAEYILNASCLASACSQYINFLCHDEVYRFFREELWTWHVEAFGPFPDFVAFSLVILLSLVVSLGVEQSKTFMDAIVVVNIGIVVFVVLAGSSYADASNWSTEEKFMPFGLSGVLTAAGTCFFCFVGFDVIPNASEEALAPTRTIPRAIILSICLSFCAYVGVSVVLTMIVPYGDLKDYAPLAEAFATRGSIFGKYVVSVGALCSMLSSLLAACFSTPRLIYSIASDGLLCTSLNKVHPTRRVPLNAVALSAITAALLALLLDMQELVQMVVIFTMVSYIGVAISVLLTRYQPHVKSGCPHSDDGDSRSGADSWLRKLYHRSGRLAERRSRSEEIQPRCPTQPNKYTNFIANSIVTVLLLCLLGFCVCLRTWLTSGERQDTFLVSTISIFGLLLVICTVMLTFQPQNSAKFPFMVPCTPLLPILSISIDMFLLVMLSKPTFIQFTIWITVGALVYLLYAYHQSKEGNRPERFLFEQSCSMPEVPVDVSISTVQNKAQTESTPLIPDVEADISMQRQQYPISQDTNKDRAGSDQN